jgi:hypothetical protein
MTKKCKKCGKEYRPQSEISERFIDGKLVGYYYTSICPFCKTPNILLTGIDIIPEVKWIRTIKKGSP